MTNIISLDEHRQAQTPHLSGEAVCPVCTHRWQAVAPVGTTNLGCPSCGSIRGQFANTVLRGDTCWVCTCGSDTFRISPEVGPYCICCGDVQQGY